MCRLNFLGRLRGSGAPKKAALHNLNPGTPIETDKHQLGSICMKND